MEQILKNAMAEPGWVQGLLLVWVLLVSGAALYVAGSLILGVYRVFRPSKAVQPVPPVTAPRISLESVPGETGEALMARLKVFAEQERARRGLPPVDDSLPTEGVWINAFYLGRKIAGVLLIGLGSLLLYEMVTMLSASDMTRKVVLGFGGCGVMLIMGGVLCLIAKKGEKALES